jgi:hypothetical protein
MLKLWPLSTLDYIKTLSKSTLIHSLNSSCTQLTALNTFLHLHHLLHYLCFLHSLDLCTTIYMHPPKYTLIHMIKPHKQIIILHKLSSTPYYELRTNKTCSNPHYYFCLSVNNPLLHAAMSLILILLYLNHCLFL